MLSVSNGLKETGIIVGEATSTEFYFASDSNNMPSKWEYIVINSQERVGNEFRPVQVLAQVDTVASQSLTLTKDLDIEAIRRIKAADIADLKLWGRARILGYLSDQKEILMPRCAVIPGHSIYLAPPSLLKEFYSYPEAEGLFIGHLITRPEVPVYVRIEGFRRHTAIIAQTGAGKSFLAGVLMEELLGKGATVLVIDPHADYVFLGFTKEGEQHSLTERIEVFRNPASTGRYSENDIPNVKPYTVRFADLSSDEICQISGIHRTWSNIKDALETTIARLRQSGSTYMPEDLENALDLTAADDSLDDKVQRGARDAKKYVQRLRYLSVFSTSGTSIEELLKPYHLSVIDLSGLEDYSMNYIVAKILDETYRKLSSEDFTYPVFLFLEEAHKFVPAPPATTYAKSVINRIAAEGRKFGLFQVLITQRPYKIDQDSLSQCNSQIIMRITNPKDQNAVAEASEALSADFLNDLPGLNRGEAIVVGEITRTPLMSKIRLRGTKEGGADIDVLSKLHAARQEVGIDLELEKTKKKEIPIERGTFTDV